MRVIRYNFANHEIITGDEDGKISVWSLKGGEALRMIFHLKKMFSKLIRDLLLNYVGTRTQRF